MATLERCYKIREIARRWNVTDGTVREVFADESAMLIGKGLTAFGFTRSRSWEGCEVGGLLIMALLSIGQVKHDAERRRSVWTDTESNSGRKDSGRTEPSRSRSPVNPNPAARAASRWVLLPLVQPVTPSSRRCQLCSCCPCLCRCLLHKRGGLPILTSAWDCLCLRSRGGDWRRRTTGR